MFEGHGFQPVDTDVDVRVAHFVVATRHLETLAAWCSHADEDRVELLVSQRLEAADRCVVADVHAHVQDDLGLVGQHLLGQAKLWDVGAHESTGPIELFEHHDVVAQRHEVVRYGERRGARPDARHSLTILLSRYRREAVAHVALQIGGNTLEPTNRDGTAIDTAPSTRWLAGAVTRASEDSWKDVGFPVEHVGVVETPLGDEANVTGNVRVSGTRPLTIHYPVVILRILIVRWLHYAISLDHP